MGLTIETVPTAIIKTRAVLERQNELIEEQNRLLQELIKVIGERR